MIIYKITNLLNGKIYIGQTGREISARWKQHNDKRSYCRFLKYAIQKYGPENFKIEEIDGANSQEELNYKEWLWIHKENSLAPNGYNLIEGGKVRKQTPEVLAKRSASMKGLIRGPQSFEHTEKIASQRRGVKQSQETVEKRAAGCRVKIVDSSGVIYDSIRHAAKALNCFPSNISANLSKKTAHCRNRTFTYLNMV